MNTPTPAEEASTPLDPAQIEHVLANYRTWLSELTQLPDVADDEETIDLHTLVGQFTALRHEVNLQTKATRTTLEQNAESVQTLSRALDTLAKPPSDTTKPLLKALTDVYDALALALRQVNKQRDAILQALEASLAEMNLPDPPSLPPRAGPPLVEQPRGFWSRLFGGEKPRAVPSDIADAVARQLLLDWRDDVLKQTTHRKQQLLDAIKLTRSSLDGMIAGYQISLNRLDRILEQSNLRPIVSLGELFDPEQMEVVEVVTESGQPAGTVLEELRRGYRRDDIVFRFAQVKVAR